MMPFAVIKKNQKQGPKQKVEMVNTLREWTMDRWTKWISQEQGKKIHELIIVLAQHHVEIFIPSALAIKG